MATSRLDEPITPRTDGSLDVPLSVLQERMYHLCTSYPGTSSPILYLCWRLTGPIDVARWTRAVGRVVDRHDSLRMRFVPAATNGAAGTGGTAGTGGATGTGGAIARISPPAGIETERIDLRGIPGDQRDAHARDLITARVRALLDLENGPLVGSVLMQLGEDDYVWLFTVHHILSDGASIALLSKEFRAHYAAEVDGVEPDVPALSIGYGDFAVWQKEMAGAGEEENLAYWKQRLAGVPYLDLPTDMPRPAEKGTRIADHVHIIRGDLGDRLEKLANETGTTLFMVLLAGLAALYTLESGQDDMCIGTLLAGRDRVEVEPVVGLFFNTVAMRIDVSGNPTFAELLTRVRATAIDGMDRANVPFGRIVGALDLPKDLSRTQVFQTLFVLHSELLAEKLDTGGLEVHDYLFIPPQSIHDLVVHGWRGNGLLDAEFRYDTALFLPETIARMARRYETLLRAAADGPQTRLFEMAMLPVPDVTEGMRAG